MSARYFCDQCGKELDGTNSRNGNGTSRVVAQHKNIAVEVLTGTSQPRVWNAGNWCTPCIVEAVASVLPVPAAMEQL